MFYYSLHLIILHILLLKMQGYWGGFFFMAPLPPPHLQNTCVGSFYEVKIKQNTYCLHHVSADNKLIDKCLQMSRWMRTKEDRRWVAERTQCCTYVNTNTGIYRALDSRLQYYLTSPRLATPARLTRLEGAGSIAHIAAPAQQTHPLGASLPPPVSK